MKARHKRIQYKRIACHVKGTSASKIKEITDEHILFEDGTEITFDHVQDCCEYNYADFKQLDDIARAVAFDTEHLVFEAVENAGFIFGNEGKMFFIPCYSSQDGYYTREINIYKNGTEVLHFDCFYCEDALY